MLMDAMGTQASSDSVREKKVKLIQSTLQTELQKILSSCILTEQYPATTIAFQFTVVEMDSDLLQSLINSASLALYKSSISCRCLPIAVTMFLSSGDKRSASKPADWITLDPNMSHIKNQ